MSLSFFSPGSNTESRCRGVKQNRQDNAILEAASVQESGGGRSANALLVLSRTAWPITGALARNIKGGHFAVASDRLANCDLVRDTGRQVYKKEQATAFAPLGCYLGETRGLSYKPVHQAGARLPANAEHPMTSGQGKVQLLSTIGLVMCLLLAGTPANVSFAQRHPWPRSRQIRSCKEWWKGTSNAPRPWRVTVGHEFIISNITDWRVRAPHWLWR